MSALLICVKLRPISFYRHGDAALLVVFGQTENCDGLTMQHAVTEARAYAFRQRVLQAKTKASRTDISENTRRAWLIIAREWTRMAEREEAKLSQETDQQH